MESAVLEADRLAELVEEPRWPRRLGRMWVHAGFPLTVKVICRILVFSVERQRELRMAYCCEQYSTIQSKTSNQRDWAD